MLPMHADERAPGTSAALLARALTESADAAVVISSSGGIDTRTTHSVDWRGSHQVP